MNSNTQKIPHAVVEDDGDGQIQLLIVDEKGDGLHERDFLHHRQGRERNTVLGMVLGSILDMEKN